MCRPVPAPVRRPGRLRGFTLIELMIVVVIAGIFAAIALPSFVQHLRKARRSDAQDAAAAVVQAQERWRASNASYTSSLTNLDVASTSKEGHYTVTLEDGTATATAYKLTLQPVANGRQAGDSACTSMTVTMRNGGLVYDPRECWGR